MKALIINKGGPGSGFHGHSGRPGKVGGSSSDGITVVDKPSFETTFKGPEYTKEFWKHINYRGNTEHPPYQDRAKNGQIDIARTNFDDLIIGLKRKFSFDKSLSDITSDYGQEYANIIDLAYKAHRVGNLVEYERLKAIGVDYYVNKANKTFNNMIENEPVKIRAELTTAMSIFNNGRFKSQFETQRSSGAYDPVMRSDAENNGLGVPFDIDTSKRPIYGYVISGDSDDISNYGSVEFVLKESVKERTTVTSGDSLGSFIDYKSVGVPFYVEDKIPGMADGIDNLASGKVPDSYVEAQIHGGVTVDDISEIVIYPDLYSYDYDNFIKNFLVTRGIAYRFSNGS